MVEIVYTSKFIRQYKKLPSSLQLEVKEKITIFCTNPSHPALRVHKLTGKLKGFWSFSVNYKYRIVYQQDEKHVATFLKVGDHTIYA